MKFDLFQRAVLGKDFPQHGLKKGDMGIVVEHIAHADQNDGYILEFFDAQGNTIDVLPVLESDLDAPRPNTILTYREMTRAA
ncbi:DUF4926 domain-containing protein [Spirosoma validum]|uniref:DUF4926 domain-containing protein n=1 Tax=Spirosoma validum TaxID=2771355 RepID=A0A927AZ23_9BACT|nr:DUF4926 domain-containing protein [Spirosoma validum]MBD2752385.1 DUF4926 domain-containing protein [Spirosoma validum]